MPSLEFTALAGQSHASHVRFLKRWLPKAVALVKRAPAEISVSLVGPKKMAELHLQFMSIPGPTDVLTFELDHDARGRVLAGEVVICVAVVRREARQRNIDLNHELLLYALHGVLHLSGFDDLTPREHAKMHKEEDRILAAIGIGEVFKKACFPADKPRRRR